MAEEVLQWLDPAPGAVMVDATLGYGGHSELIANRIGSGGRLIGVDLDSDAVEACRLLAPGWAARTDLVQAGYDEMEAVLDRLGIATVDGVLADLGVSSAQLDQAERGFSFQKDGPLDMRMDPHGSPSAAEWLAESSEAEIRRALAEFGEEIRAMGVARAIVREREKRPIETTGHLVEVVLRCFKDKSRAGRVHPATRTFQALRIVVNRELERLERLLSFLPGRLGPGGRVVILAYHSLEDRMVKRAFAEWSGRDDPVLRRVPLRGEITGRVKILTPKVIRPRPEEVERNPRSRSARLRAAERTSKP
jgi:16S rRNA (cytosine1402-N4)-methyltransferase